jgi:hypothetical protein
MRIDRGKREKIYSVNGKNYSLYMVTDCYEKAREFKRLMKQQGRRNYIRYRSYISCYAVDVTNSRRGCYLHEMTGKISPLNSRYIQYQQ